MGEAKRRKKLGQLARPKTKIPAPSREIEERGNLALDMLHSKGLSLSGLGLNQRLSKINEVSKELGILSDLYVNIVREEYPERFLTLDCGPGCHACCYLRVQVTPLEIPAIVAFLSTQTVISLERWSEIIAESAMAFRGQSDCDRILGNRPCPFLNPDGRCAIYPVRPVSCRTYFALSRADCEYSRSPSCTNVSIEVLNVQDDGTAVHYAAMELLREADMDATPIELVEGVSRFLRDQSLLQRWLDGEQGLFLFAHESTRPAER